ncbi:MAG: YggT family protein [Gammaproteobacteria bacterium]|nr:YggT family protein [Gammaproteobacteria bacterium]NNM13545.1 YggT family protein [Gammaproteobacteria bacterium]
MAALTFLLEIFLNLFLSIYLLRFILQMVRANFRNPIAQAITRLTNPVVMPLRKVLPPIGKIDSASMVSCLLVAIICQFILHSLRMRGLDWLSENFSILLIGSALLLVFSLIQLYIVLIIFQIILSWIQPTQHSPLTAFLHELTAPLLTPARRLIKPIGGLDLSPALVILILAAIQVQLASWFG